MDIPARSTVSCELHLRLVVSDDSSVLVPADLCYDASDPYAIHASFWTGTDEKVDWVFARELLAEGLRRSAGTGDVRVWPDHSHSQSVICIALSSPEGYARLEAPARALQSFLARTNAAVPPGAEHQYYDLEAELDQLLRRRIRQHPSSGTT